jgi:hypothetical protein
MMLAAMPAQAPPAALAVGSDDSEPPKTGTTVCEAGPLWDEKTGTCVKPDEKGVNHGQRFGAARELADAGHHEAVPGPQLPWRPQSGPERPAHSDQRRTE